MSTPICAYCRKMKKDMRAYVPTQKLNGIMYIIGKPCFICSDCEKDSKKTK